MTHPEFVAAYREGRVRVSVDRAQAARMVSARLLLPFVLLPVLGIGVAFALVGHYLVGALVFLAGLGLRLAVRRTAPGFIVQRALEDARFYDEARATRLLQIN